VDNLLMCHTAFIKCEDEMCIYNELSCEKKRKERRCEVEMNIGKTIGT
jgi:hypothetical protein